MSDRPEMRHLKTSKEYSAGCLLSRCDGIPQEAIPVENVDSNDE